MHVEALPQTPEPGPNRWWRHRQDWLPWWGLLRLQIWLLSLCRSWGLLWRLKICTRDQKRRGREEGNKSHCLGGREDGSPRVLFGCRRMESHALWQAERPVTKLASRFVRIIGFPYLLPKRQRVRAQTKRHWRRGHWKKQWGYMCGVQSLHQHDKADVLWVYNQPLAQEVKDMHRARWQI